MSYAMRLIKTLIYTRATECKLETATIVLNELYRLKKTKEIPFFAIRRAIKLQEAVIKNLNKES